MAVFAPSDVFQNRNRNQNSGGTSLCPEVNATFQFLIRLDRSTIDRVTDVNVSWYHLNMIIEGVAIFLASNETANGICGPLPKLLCYAEC